MILFTIVWWLAYATEPSVLSTCRFYLLAQARPKGAKRWMVGVWQKNVDFT